MLIKLNAFGSLLFHVNQKLPHSPAPSVITNTPRSNQEYLELRLSTLEICSSNVKLPKISLTCYLMLYVIRKALWDTTAASVLSEYFSI